MFLLLNSVWLAYNAIRREASQAAVAFGHPLQIGLPVHRCAIDRDGGSQSGFSDRKTFGRVENRYPGIVSGSPPQAFKA